MLNRMDLVERLRDKKYTKKDAITIIDDVFDTVAEMLVEGESLHIHGFGKFEVKELKEKRLRDFKTGELVSVPPTKTPKFTAGEKLKKAVREGFYRA